ncbi:hypothetical protein YC2023_021728 [Brassica napus]
MFSLSIFSLDDAGFCVSLDESVACLSPSSLSFGPASPSLHLLSRSVPVSSLSIGDRKRFHFLPKLLFRQLSETESSPFTYLLADVSHPLLGILPPSRLDCSDSGKRFTRNCLATFHHRLKAGYLFTLSGFYVPQCNQRFRLTDSPLTIRFSDSTTFDELTKPVSPIPEERFRFRDHDSFHGLANTNTHLPVMYLSFESESSSAGISSSGLAINKSRVSAAVKVFKKA